MDVHNRHEMVSHLVQEHGVPAGFVESTDYTVGEWQWEHRGYHDAHDHRPPRPAGPATRVHGPGHTRPAHDRTHEHNLADLPMGDGSYAQLAQRHDEDGMDL